MINHSERVLALEVHPLSYGFTVFEGPDHLIDWGVRSFRRGVNAVKVPMSKKLALLISDYRPGIILMGGPKTGASRRLNLINKVATEHGVRVRAFSRNGTKRAFPDAHNKHELALAVASRIPPLSPYIPPKRKSWEPEHYRMSMFGAAAIGLSYFDRMVPTGQSLD